MSIRRQARLAMKASLFVRVWVWFVIITVLLRIRPLPELVGRLTVAPTPPLPQTPPRRLGRAVWRSLSIAGYRPRCLTASLVLYRLLAEQGRSAELVVGLPPEPTDNRAHAWVEVNGVDVGPPPGKQGHEELARYGVPGPTLQPSPAATRSAGARTTVGRDRVPPG